MPDDRQIEVTFEDGEVIEVQGIPHDAKITFAQLNPNTAHTGFGRGRRDSTPNVAGLTLRIYKGARDNGNQLAVFRDVQSFRDMSLNIITKKKTEKKEFI